MITGRPQKNLNSAKIYFRKHLTSGDYHSENKTVQGQWVGKGAERLGLSLNAPVGEKEFLRLCDNRHPGTGQLLTVRNRKKERRVFYDFVASAPKSISIMALTVGDSRIVTAHDEATRIALTRMEKAAATRVRKKNQRSERPTGEITAAIFQHRESRALDPQLHTHLVVFNATWDPVEKRWKALETSVIYDRIKFFTEVYRSELAYRLKQLGYQLRNTDHGFEIEGVSPELIERFSKRRRAILKEEAELVGEGAPLSNNARAKVARTTRPKKRTDLTDDDILAFQRAQMSAEEMETLRNLTQGQLNDAPLPEKISPQAAIDYAVEHLFERNSEVEIKHLYTEALKYGRGHVRLEELEKEFAGRTEFIRFHDSVTTKEALQQEQRLIALVNQGLNGCRPLFPEFKADASLSAEERQAFEFLLQSPDEVVALRGWAGTGKTTLLQKLLATIETKYEAVVLAPTAAAVDELRQRGLKQAATVHRFLSSPEFQEKSRGKAIVVDEAGLLSVRDLLAVVAATRALSARLILSGDSLQHHSVEAGDALRLLEGKSALRTVTIRNIRRQVDEEYRKAIGELAQGRGQTGLNRLERLGAVKELPDAVRYQKLTEAYVASVKAGKTALAVSPTWREIELVTAGIRSGLKAEKLLSQAENILKVHHGLKWTRAEKRDLRNYRPGLVLTFHKATKEFKVNEWAELQRVEGKHLRLKKPDGAEVRVTGKQSSCFDVAEKVELPVAAGEKLLLQGNRKGDQLFNGQVVTVDAVQKDGGITLADGRKIQPDFRAFTYGYCLTSHASQGRKADHVFVAVDSKTFNAANLNQFYVSASRGVERVQIYTDKMDFLKKAVNEPGRRLSASELAESVRLSRTHKTSQSHTTHQKMSA